jgi:hypothetical protein
MDPRVDAIYRLVKGRVNFTNIVATCVEIAQEIEQFGEIGGAEKLSILQEVLRAVVRERKISITEKEELLHRIDTLVPLVVGAAIFASKHPITKKLHATCVGCFWRKK